MLYLRNPCNIFRVDGVIRSKNGGKTASCVKRMMHQFSLRFLVWIPPSTQKIIQRFLIILFRRFLTLILNDVTVANDVGLNIIYSDFFSITYYNKFM